MSAWQYEMRCECNSWREQVDGVGGAMDGGGLWTTAPIELMVAAGCVGGAVDAQPLKRRMRWVGGTGDGMACAPFHTDHSPCCFAEPQIYFWFRRTREREREWAAVAGLMDGGGLWTTAPSELRVSSLCVGVETLRPCTIHLQAVGSMISLQSIQTVNLYTDHMNVTPRHGFSRTCCHGKCRSAVCHFLTSA